MINQSKVYEYINRASKTSSKELDKDTPIQGEDSSEAFKILQRLDGLDKDTAYKDEVKEEGIPSDLSAAIVHIKNEAKRGDERAIEALNKIRKSFDVV